MNPLKNSRIIVTGSLGMDVIMDFPGRFADRIMPDKLHQISLSFLVDTMKRNFGGTAGNIAYSLKLLGMEPLLVSIAGSDFGPYKKFLEKHKINTSAIVIRKDLPTSTYTVITDKDDNQIGSFYLGPTSFAHELDITKALPAGFIVIAPTAPKGMMKYVKDAITLKMPYLFDPAFQIETFSAEELKHAISHAKILIGNDYEIALMEKKLGYSHAELLKMVPVLITTLGGKGSRIDTETEHIEIGVAKVSSVVDPTGAGDAYRAGFLAGYLCGKDLKSSGQMGSLAAAYAVENYGTVTHLYTPDQFQKRYLQNFKEQIFL